MGQYKWYGVWLNTSDSERLIDFLLDCNIRHVRFNGHKGIDNIEMYLTEELVDKVNDFIMNKED